MVTYSVQIKIRYDLFDEYVAWLKNEHINEMLAVPGFIEADLCTRKGGAMESSSKDIQITYKLQNEDALKNYMSEYAMPLREKGLEKFAGQYSAQREIWLDTIKFVSK
jgi:antibiotic biosynthesis monooxygenase (ABM) superfamily enzyme